MAVRKPATQPTARPKKAAADDALRLHEESWGDRVHRAYRTARARYGKEQITYRLVAKRISRFYPITDATILRLEEYDEPPTHPRVLLAAYLALVCYGYDPAAFELDLTQIPEWAKDRRKVLDLLKPSSRCTQLSADSAA